MCHPGDRGKAQHPETRAAGLQGTEATGGVTLTILLTHLRAEATGDGKPVNEKGPNALTEKRIKPTSF